MKERQSALFHLPPTRRLVWMTALAMPLASVGQAADTPRIVHFSHALTAIEVNKALSLSTEHAQNTAMYTNPGLQPGAPLPQNAQLKSDGYYISMDADDFTYSFLEAEHPAGSEVLFACDRKAPWWAWTTMPKACGIAIIVAPDRRGILNAYSTLDVADLDYGYAANSTRAGRVFLGKMQPYFQPKLAQCAHLVPYGSYAWAARISSNGRVARSGVFQLSGKMPGQTEAYRTCISEYLQQLNAPSPPKRAEEILWHGGWPVTIRWEHSPTGDRIEQK